MLILSLILAHLIAEFYLQTDEMVKGKLQSIKKHLIHHFMLNLLVLSGSIMFRSEEGNIIYSLLFPLGFIILTHFIIDFAKIKMLDTIKINNEENMKRLGFFVVDQLLHFLIIILSGTLFFGFDLTNVLHFFEGNQKLNTVNSILFIIIIIIYLAELQLILE